MPGESLAGGWYAQLVCDSAVGRDRLRLLNAWFPTASLYNESVLSGSRANDVLMANPGIGVFWPPGMLGAVEGSGARLNLANLPKR
jgi:hypothetical protein